MADTGIWNVNFTKRLKPGDAGNQAHFGIFYADDRGSITRLVEAEGHEISYNPEAEETNPIGQEAPSSLIRSYNESFGKDIIIKKGAPNYEFFRRYLELRPTGDNAKLKIYMVNFMEEEARADQIHYRYLAYSYTATCQVDSGNYTDGRLTVNFTQDGDRTTGIMERTDSSASDDPSTFVYGFTPSTRIDITGMSVSEDEVELPVGGEKWVAVSFSPLGCPYDFDAESEDENICKVERRRQSIIIRGRGTGSTSVTVTSTANSAQSEIISVTVA